MGSEEADMLVPDDRRQGREKVDGRQGSDACSSSSWKPSGAAGASGVSGASVASDGWQAGWKHAGWRDATWEAPHDANE